MAVVPVVVGACFVLVGAWAFTHPNRQEVGAAGWLSYAAGRRVGGALTVAAGAALIVIAALLS